MQDDFDPAPTGNKMDRPFRDLVTLSSELPSLQQVDETILEVPHEESKVTIVP